MNAFGQWLSAKDPASRDLHCRARLSEDGALARVFGAMLDKGDAEEALWFIWHWLALDPKIVYTQPFIVALSQECGALVMTDAAEAMLQVFNKERGAQRALASTKGGA